MSAWMFGHDQIDRVVDAFRWAQVQVGAGTGQLGSNDELAWELLKLNAASIEHRYSSNEMPNAHEYKPAKGKKNLLQQYKTLKCFLYQCAEGPVPEMKLYKIIEDSLAVYERLGHSEKSRGYNDLDWG